MAAKYNVLHKIKPEEGNPLYFLFSDGLEHLGTFTPPHSFNSLSGQIRGFYAKFWRPLNDAEILLLPSKFRSTTKNVESGKKERVVKTKNVKLKK